MGRFWQLYVRAVVRSHKAVDENIVLWQFPGERQRGTPVTDVRNIVELVMLLPGKRAATVRRQAAELLVRYLGGDIRLVDEVLQNRRDQEGYARGDPRTSNRSNPRTSNTTAAHSSTKLAWANFPDKYESPRCERGCAWRDQEQRCSRISAGSL